MISKSSEKWADISRNVLDKYKNLSTEEIKNNLKETSFPYAVMMENLEGDYNFSTLVRNANAFNAKEVFYLSNKKGYDKRGAVGTYNYTDVNYLENYNELLKLKEKYVFIGMDNVSGSEPMESFSWPKNSLIIFGSESSGLTNELKSLCDKIVHISQHGSVRSLNVGCASAIALYDYTTKYARA